MDKTIRNLDEDAYLKIRAQAVLKGVNVGILISEAIKRFLSLPEFDSSEKSFKDLPTFDFGSNNKNLSKKIDEVLYS